MIIDNNLKLNYDDVLIKPKQSNLSSRSEVSLFKKFFPKYGTPFLGIPIIASNMATGTFDMLNIFLKYKMFVAIAKFESSKWFNFLDNSILDQYINYGFYTVGIKQEDVRQFNKFFVQAEQSGYDSSKIKICVDIANGYMNKFLKIISDLRNEYPKNVIIAGNVATPDAVEKIIQAGVDYAKVGISQGYECQTRLKTGIGYPQLSATIECAEAAHALNAGIISDGGIRSPGDFAKSFCGGADMVMAGTIFSGTDECNGDIINEFYKTGNVILKYINADGTKKYEDEIKERKYKLFYGMSSAYAQNKFLGGMNQYRTSEGDVEKIPYKGSVSFIIDDILGGLRSTGTYLNALTIADFYKNATFVRTNKIHDKF